MLFIKETFCELEYNTFAEKKYAKILLKITAFVFIIIKPAIRIVQYFCLTSAIWGV